MKIANIDREILHNFFFRKNVNYDNIKSHKAPGSRRLLRRYLFQKTTGEGGGGEGVKLTPPSRFRVNNQAMSRESYQSALYLVCIISSLH